MPRGVPPMPDTWKIPPPPCIPSGLRWIPAESFPQNPLSSAAHPIYSFFSSFPVLLPNVSFNPSFHLFTPLIPSWLNIPARQFTTILFPNCLYACVLLTDASILSMSGSRNPIRRPHSLSVSFRTRYRCTTFGSFPAWLPPPMTVRHIPPGRWTVCLWL